METELDDVTPHIDEYKETVEASNKLVETSYIAMFTAGVIWVIAVWKLFEVLF